MPAEFRIVVRDEGGKAPTPKPQPGQQPPPPPPEPPPVAGSPAPAQPVPAGEKPERSRRKPRAPADSPEEAPEQSADVGRIVREAISYLGIGGIYSKVERAVSLFSEVQKLFQKPEPPPTPPAQAPSPPAQPSTPAPAPPRQRRGPREGAERTVSEGAKNIVDGLERHMVQPLADLIRDLRAEVAHGRPQPEPENKPAPPVSRPSAPEQTARPGPSPPPPARQQPPAPPIRQTNADADQLVAQGSQTIVDGLERHMVQPLAELIRDLRREVARGREGERQEGRQPRQRTQRGGRRTGESPSPGRQPGPPRTGTQPPPASPSTPPVARPAPPPVVQPPPVVRRPPPASSPPTPAPAAAAGGAAAGRAATAGLSSGVLLLGGLTLGAAAVAGLAVSAKKATDAIGPMGVAAVGFVAAINPLAGILVGPILRGIKSFGDKVREETERLSRFSGPLAFEQARSDLRRELATFREAQQLGPQLAKFEEARSRASAAVQDSITQFKAVVLDYAERLLPLIDAGVDSLEMITELIKLIKAGQDAAKAIRRADAAALLDSQGRILAAQKRIAEILEGRDDERLDEDPFLKDLLSNLDVPGTSPAVPRRAGAGP